MKMSNNLSRGRRFQDYQPSRGIWFWSCAACIVGTVVIGFTWGGWVTGGTATRMAADAAAGANAQMAAADCVIRFENSPDATAQLAALRKAESYNRSDLIEKGGWVTMPGSKEPVEGAALICAQKLVNTKTAPANG
jgi:GH24 family phage-related lysozyme (muramidase)